MLTLERKFRKIVPEELALLPEVEYPPETIAELDDIYHETMKQFQAGELIPMTAEEMAAEFGIDLVEDD